MANGRAAEQEANAIRRVLVVEDEDPIRDIVVMALAGEGHEVYAARHGAEALAALEHWSPDVILLDVMMPVMNGWQFAAAYRALPGPHAPVVVVSATSDMRARCHELGADGCCEKPFDLDNLIQVVMQPHHQHNS